MNEVGPQERLLERVKNKLARPLVHIYFGRPDEDDSSRGYRHTSGESGFAGMSFLRLKPNHPCAFHPADLLAVSLLDVSLGPRALEPLLTDGEHQRRVSNLLSVIPASPPLSEAEYQSAVDLWDMLCELPGCGYVTAGKLMARKRPHVFPIVDSVVENAIRAPNDRYWETFWEFLQTDDGSEYTTGLRPASLPQLPLLRVLDAAIWMIGSSGQQAERARDYVRQRQSASS